MENKGKKAIYVSVTELAKMLGISHVAVFKRIKKGQVPAIKIGRSYAISTEYVNDLMHKGGPRILTKNKKKEIKQAVERVVKEYGETLRLLGKE
ncbi:MAG: helix-turn-helix domain-containing protein [bacterium]|nr:helix-turn-helix domain-containing protein [bacterium]